MSADKQLDAEQAGDTRVSPRLTAAHLHNALVTITDAYGVALAAKDEEIAKLQRRVADLQRALSGCTDDVFRRIAEEPRVFWNGVTRGIEQVETNVRDGMTTAEALDQARARFPEPK